MDDGNFSASKKILPIPKILMIINDVMKHWTSRNSLVCFILSRRTCTKKQPKISNTQVLLTKVLILFIKFCFSCYLVFSFHYLKCFTIYVFYGTIQFFLLFLSLVLRKEYRKTHWTLCNFPRTSKTCLTFVIYSLQVHCQQIIRLNARR